MEELASEEMRPGAEKQMLRPPEEEALPLVCLIHTEAEVLARTSVSTGKFGFGQ